jgi:ferredoxin/flavodoxin
VNALVCYFSNTGNTRLVCSYLTKYLDNIDCTLWDMNQDIYPQLSKYELIGFASSVEFFGLPKFIYDWFADFPPLKNPKLSFLLTTYGNIAGTTILQLRSLVQDKGFRVIAGHTLHMPDNFPVSRIKGFSAFGSPNKQEIGRFHLFAVILKDLIESMKAGHEILEASFKLSLMNYFFNIPDRYAAKRSMGFKFVNEDICTKCSLCAIECPYHAIEMDSYPVFVEELCYGCWRCYNLCPMLAIYTNKIKGKGHYSGPPEFLLEKFDQIKPKEKN